MSTSRRHRSYGSQVAFIDLLFNTLVGFVFLFVMAFVLINPIAKKSNVELNAEFIITLKWPKKSEDDVDLWVRDPLGNVAGFKSKDVGLMSLDRDDLGGANDTVIGADGKPIKVYNNEEHMTIRGIIPGEYIVNIHLYNKKLEKQVKRKSKYYPNIPVTITVEKLNPYGIVTVREITLTEKGQEITAVRFTVDEEGNVSNVNQLPYQMIGNPYTGTDDGINPASNLGNAQQQYFGAP